MRILTIIALLLSIAANAPAQRTFVAILGIAQDAGVPQMGCDTPFCRRAWNDSSLTRRVSSIALVDPVSKSRWIFDATPDLPSQFELLKQITGDRTNRLDGIFLTHAHIGHYTGLMYLGRESMNTKDVNIYAMPRMKAMLEQNAPWSQLVSLKNIVLNGLETDRAVTLPGNLKVTPFLVPHRDEFSETVGYRIESRDKSLIYIPDIDKWEKWSRRLVDVVRENDYLLIDGTFYADGEISRPMNEVPHPFVIETFTLLDKLPKSERAKVYFTHFNHSNPLVQGDRGKLRELRRRGYKMATEGLRLPL